jgi:hypothetical protein
MPQSTLCPVNESWRGDSPLLIEPCKAIQPDNIRDVNSSGLGDNQCHLDYRGRLAASDFLDVPTSRWLEIRLRSCPPENSRTKDNEAAIGLRDILIIAPYNAQVFELQDRIHGGRIGTVDKFQGQGAPIVIYSVATSSYLDAPRGMEFLDEKDVEEIEAHRSKTRQAAPDSSEGNLHRWRP